jgi:thymidylate synthase
MVHEENQYLELIKDILDNGDIFNGRNGTTKAIIGSMMRYSLDDDTVPLLTTKRMAWKTCMKELLFFIKGQTDNKILKSQKVNIWNENGSREFLDSRNLKHYKEDDLGPVYGFQWRHFNTPYINCDTDYTNKGIDQLQKIIDSLKNPETRYSRRLILTAWNPNQLNEMALPPCHLLSQFNVVGEDKLTCTLYQRSGDVGLGVPFNIASYAFLTHIIAKICGLKAHKFIHFISNAHIYDDHFENLANQLNNSPYKFPKLKISSVKNIDDYTIEDFVISDYNYHSAINLKMRK